MYIIIALVALVFIVLTGVVISRLQGVLKSINKTDSEEVETSGNKFNGAMFIVILIGGAISITWSYLHAREFFLPEASSIHGRRTDDLFWFSMGILTIPFIIVKFLVFFFSWKYQHRKGHRATFYPENHKLELIWTIIPAIVMALLVFTGWKAWPDITAEAPRDAEVIEITGKQFNWLIRYPGKDGQLGRKDFKNINDANNPVGQDWEDQLNKDDYMATEMHLVVNKPVKLIIGSRDVIHDVGLSHFRLKMDAVPGIPTTLWFTPTKTTAQMREATGNADFVYEISCDQMCGAGHYSMKANIVVETQAEYDAWAAKQVAQFAVAHPAPAAAPATPAATTPAADSAHQEKVVAVNDAKH